MRKEAIVILAQLLTGIKDALGKLEEAQKKNDIEEFGLAKKEILHFHKQIDEVLKSDR